MCISPWLLGGIFVSLGLMLILPIWMPKGEYDFASLIIGVIMIANGALCFFGAWAL
jgi:hypothetical protein